MKAQKQREKFNKTKVKVWVCVNNSVWFEQRDKETNQTYFVNNRGHEVSVHELFKNYYPKPFCVV